MGIARDDSSAVASCLQMPRHERQSPTNSASARSATRFESLRFCRTLAQTVESRRELGRQLLRAGMGVAGNYWSACRGRSDTGVHREAWRGRSSEADESVLWLTAIDPERHLTTASETKESAGGRTGDYARFSQKSHKTAQREPPRKAKQAKLSQSTQFTNSPIHQLSTDSRSPSMISSSASRPGPHALERQRRQRLVDHVQLRRGSRRDPARCR